MFDSKHFKISVLSEPIAIYDPINQLCFLATLSASAFVLTFDFFSLVPIVFFFNSFLFFVLFNKQIKHKNGQPSSKSTESYGPTYRKCVAYLNLPPFI